MALEPCGLRRRQPLRSCKNGQKTFLCEALYKFGRKPLLLAHQQRLVYVWAKICKDCHAQLKEGEGKETQISVMIRHDAPKQIKFTELTSWRTEGLR